MASVPWEQWPDESDEEYALLEAYYADTSGKTPRQWLVDKGYGVDLFVRASNHGWVARKNAFLAWQDDVRRHQWLNLLDSYYQVLQNRLPYLLQREMFARNLEGIGKPPQSEKKIDQPHLRAAYAKAVAQTNTDIALIARVAKALQKDGGINIQNVVGGLPGLPAKGGSAVAEIAEGWGAPEIEAPPSDP